MVAQILSMMEKVLFLKKVSLFSELNSDILIAIAEVAEERDWNEKEVIFRENESGDTLYLIVFGEVEISITPQNSQKRVLNIAKSTEIFGEMSLFDSSPRSATAIAAKPVKLLALRKNQFRDLISEYPEIMFEMYRIAIERLRKADKHVTDNSPQNNSSTNGTN
ncbi:MAG: cyclic nucleotide-binding domain-containing protein [Elusimicrobiota bacterium]